MLIINIYKKFGRKNIFFCFFLNLLFIFFLFRHPFLLYAHFIDRWKKRLNKDDDSSIDDNELEPMFIDDEENVEGKKKKSNDKQKKVI